MPGIAPGLQPLYRTGTNFGTDMLPWIELDRATIPGNPEPLRLKKRGGEYSIMLGANGLMNSRLSGSEEELARLAIERLGGRKAIRILIGGLGMGFTLRAALALTGPDASIEVAELVPQVVDWARGPMAEVFAGCLEDPRVSIHVGDVGLRIASARAAYDAILMDVDNGPEGLSRPGNDALYDHAGLGHAKAALKPGGIYAVWSAHTDPGFTRRLKQAGLKAEEIPTRAGRGRGKKHMIWVATRPG